MDFEFHYYITGMIAYAAGFNKQESEIIAYSSQFVDDNTIVYTVQNKKTDEAYSNYISQTMNIFRPRKTLMRIYPVFHFIPGHPIVESARRRDGKMHVLNTTPGSAMAQGLMYRAFESSLYSRLYRIGIATHGYVDTWAHQNFVGTDDGFNGFAMNPMPNIGHADALLAPDMINKKWIDKRIVESDVDNNLRFMEAAKSLFYLYTDYLETDKERFPFEKVLLKIMNCSKQKERLELYSKQMPWLQSYDKSSWFVNAIDQEVIGLKDSTNEFLAKFTIFKDQYWWKNGIKKEDTDWFKFQEAIKEHQAKAWKVINDGYGFIDANACSF
jgi:hypothetical protein